jgi:hypothetical protein
MMEIELLWFRRTSNCSLTAWYRPLECGYDDGLLRQQFAPAAPRNARTRTNSRAHQESRSRSRFLRRLPYPDGESARLRSSLFSPASNRLAASPGRAAGTGKHAGESGQRSPLQQPEQVLDFGNSTGDPGQFVVHGSHPGRLGPLCVADNVFAFFVEFYCREFKCVSSD